VCACEKEKERERVCVISSSISVCVCLCEWVCDSPKFKGENTRKCFWDFVARQPQYIIFSILLQFSLILYYDTLQILSEYWGWIVLLIFSNTFWTSAKISTLFNLGQAVLKKSEYRKNSQLLKKADLISMTFYKIEIQIQIVKGVVCNYVYNNLIFETPPCFNEANLGYR